MSASNSLIRGAGGAFIKRLAQNRVPQVEQRRGFWVRWLNEIANRVNLDRIEAVGPERAAAEWLVRNGASFRSNISHHFESDYNRLVANTTQITNKKWAIEDIYAKDASLVTTGFMHLKGLSALKRIALVDCIYLEDTALKYLEYVEPTLEHVELLACTLITQSGVGFLGELRNLKFINLYNLPSCDNFELALEELQLMLPNCKIISENKTHLDGVHGSEKSEEKSEDAQ